MSYSIFFDYNNTTYRIPVNPEEVKTENNLSIEKYNILNLGQVAVANYKELNKYSFETEFPYKAASYVNYKNNFKNSDFWVSLFEGWMKNKTVVRFIASNGIGKDINTLVLISSLGITEKAGEEGDKYISFELLEYRKFDKKVATVKDLGGNKATSNQSSNENSNPKATNRTYTVVSGDTLWGIATRYYGNGAQYPKIYNANRNIISNPNLIYPGQRLVIP
ncbi:LysM peptidoglycan-binding domain-containing protein [Clostridium tertium]|uniref:LysM peptidoglycan-binding domain-containing protein n=1 Tax=Clostridium tertium TaxID=1559 RepID=A0A9X4B1Z5_9CLOT|nr:LysM peptidoglycan-binding domain-containing protein [Clostridium tertium]MDC4242439.1 LysM peptidoglycan-binding domain-containing protein [Clostridium tertium]